jgi:hypothetical protein
MIDTKADTITVGDVTYDVERNENVGFPAATRFTLEIDGEPVFEGLEGVVGYEEHDQEHANPRKDCSNVGTMFCDYSGYTLGDEDAPDPREQTVECGNCEGEGTVAGNPDDGEADEIECPICGGEGELPIDMAEYLRREHGARVVLPLYVYEHSGITISSGAAVRTTVKQSDIDPRGHNPFDTAAWDTSMVGFIFDTPDGVEQCIGEDATDEQIEQALESEVKIYASYLEGNVYYYNVEDDETDFNEGCGPMLDEYPFKYIESELFSSLERAIEKRLAEQAERAEWAARDTITV